MHNQRYNYCRRASYYCTKVKGNENKFICYGSPKEFSSQNYLLKKLFPENSLLKNLSIKAP